MTDKRRKKDNAKEGSKKPEGKPSAPIDNLATRNVFIDTQQFRKLGFDWDGSALSALRDLGASGVFKLLTTPVTRDEIKSLLLELLEAAKKQRPQVMQITGFDLSSDEAPKLLLEKFEQYFDRAKFETVPTTANLTGILSDYFNRTPPFSDKKQREFPDAIAIRSLREWAASNKETIYIVSDDGDMPNCCNPSGPLYHIATVPELLDAVTITTEIRNALHSAVISSAELKNIIRAAIQKRCGIYCSPPDETPFGQVRSARLIEVGEISLNNMNVYRRDGTEFSGKIQFVSELFIIANAESDTLGTSSFEFWTTQTSFSDLTVRFDPKHPKDIEIVEFRLGEYSVTFHNLYARRRPI